VKALGDGITFLRHPASRRSLATWDPKASATLAALAQAFGQHARVLHRHAAGLAHQRGAKDRHKINARIGG